MAPSAQNHAYALIEPEFIREPINRHTRAYHADLYVPVGERQVLDQSYQSEDEAQVGPIDCAPLLPRYITKATALRRGPEAANSYECDSALIAYVDRSDDELSEHSRRWFAWIPTIAIDGTPLYDTLIEARAARVGVGQIAARVYDRQPTVPYCGTHTARLLPGRIRAQQQSRERAFAKYFLKELTRYSSTPIFGKKPLSPLPPEWATNQMRLMRETFDFRPEFDYEPLDEDAFTGLHWQPNMGTNQAMYLRDERLRTRQRRTFPGRGWYLAPELGNTVLSRYNYRWVQRRNRT